MLPIYLVFGLLNIFSQHHNYGIKIDDPNFDVRVRRSTPEGVKQQVFNIISNNEDNNLKREKRYAYYEKTSNTDNNLIRHSNDNNNIGSNSTRNNTNKYDIFNPNWNYLFNTTKNNRNNVNNPTINNRQIIISSYPYGYPPGYAPNSGAATGRTANTTGFRNQNNNAPHFYNYQDPNRQNFAGFVGYAADNSGHVNTPMPYATRANNTDASNATWKHALAPYPPSYTQKPVPNPSNNNFPTTNNMPSSYAPTNSGIQNLPYATNPANGVYNNNFNSIQKPFDNYNLSPYETNFNNGSTNLNKGSANFNSGSFNFNTGTAYFNNGSPNSNIRPTNVNTETAYFNNGSPNFNTGTPNVNTETAYFNNGYPNSNIRSTNVNTESAYFNNGSPNFNTVSPSVNNATADFTTVSPNFNTRFPKVNNGSYAPANNTDMPVTTTEKILKICVICNIPCPKFMRRFGQFCMDPDAVDDDY